MIRNCGFCSRSDANYVCPKCGFFYCSLDCYRHRNHLECSELFYKDLVLQELSLNTDTKLKEKTMELLERMNLEDESLDFQDFLDDKDRPGKSSSILGQLTDEFGLPLEERAKFDKLVKNGGIFNLLPANFWDPWYIKAESLLVKENDNYQGDEEIEEDDHEDIPSYPTDLPKLVEISKQQPSPLMKCALIQTIFSYCAVCRYFVGSQESSSFEPYDLMIKISPLNCPQIPYPTTGQCLQFVSRYLIEQKQMPLCFIEKLYMDTSLIIKTGNRLVLRCLVDIVKLCKEAKKRKKISANEGNDRSSNHSQIIRKVQFYMSWCVENEPLYQSDLPSIHFEALSLKELINESQEMRSHANALLSKKSDPDETRRKLIEIVESPDSI